MRAKDLDPEVRALASAPGHVCFSLTEDLHGCRKVDRCLIPDFPADLCACCLAVCRMWGMLAQTRTELRCYGCGRRGRIFPSAWAGKC